MKKCLLCSKFYSLLKKLSKLVGFPLSLDCRGINHETSSSKNRVNEISSLAPECACEKYKMSPYSPGIVEEYEQLSIYVFLPMHENYIDKSGNAKPSIFNHVFSNGRSVQRENKAQESELVSFTSNFLSRDPNRSWKGAITGNVGDIRSISTTNNTQRALCVYDTSEKDNPAHAEICQSQLIDEEDKLELKHDLLCAFNKGLITPPEAYRNSRIYSSLSNELRSR